MVPIPGFERYRIDDYGTVYGLVVGNRPLTAQPNMRGYLYVGLRQDGHTYPRYIHRLVCMTFHGPPPEPHYHASHLDGDKLNNHKDNLAWETPEQNNARKYEHNKTRYARGEQQGLSKLTEVEVIEIRRLRELGNSQYKLATLFNVSRPTIRQVVTNQTWRHLL